jgi:hypothetical protein
MLRRGGKGACGCGWRGLEGRGEVLTSEGGKVLFIVLCENNRDE